MTIGFPKNVFKKIKRRKKLNPTREMFETLTSLGFEAKHIVDIGGNHGDWSRDALHYYPNANFTIFEPQLALSEFHRDLAEKSNIQLRYLGLGDLDGTATFTLHDRDDSSSFAYSTDEAETEGFQQIDIDIRRLDSEMESSEFGAPQIVKIDAEGFDLRVIEGAKSTLSTAEVVLVEAAVNNPQFDNTVLKVIDTMDKIGMKLWNITDLNRTPQRKILWLIEAVFVRNGGFIDSCSQNYD